MPAAAAAVGLGVLIVEDDPFVHRPLERLLTRWNFEVRIVESVAAAIDSLVALPSCLLLDLMLPDGYGTEVLRHIQREALPVRVAVVTGTGDTQLLEEVRALKPDALFTKPVNLTHLKAWLERCRD